MGGRGAGLAAGHSRRGSVEAKAMPIRDMRAAGSPEPAVRCASRAWVRVRRSALSTLCPAVQYSRVVCGVVVGRHADEFGNFRVSPGSAPHLRRARRKVFEE